MLQPLNESIDFGAWEHNRLPARSEDSLDVERVRMMLVETEYGGVEGFFNMSAMSDGPYSITVPGGTAQPTRYQSAGQSHVRASITNSGH